MGFLAVLFFIQDRMIFPGAATQGTPQSACVRPAPDRTAPALATPRGERVVGLFGPALLPDGRPHPDPASRPALLYFYGNAMCLAYAEPEFERFRRLGLNVLIPDYLGYGRAAARPPRSVAARRRTRRYQALRSRGFPASRIIAGGWSLGGAVAIDLAYRQPVGGLIAFSTFTSTHDMAQAIVPLSLPACSFVHKFDSLDKIPGITCPILLGHGRQDTLVPFSMHDRTGQGREGAAHEADHRRGRA